MDCNVKFRIVNNAIQFNGTNKLKMEIEQLFEKRFQYHCTTVLPPLESVYSEYYQLETLQNLKERLNNVKSKLNNYTTEEWSQHTRRRDPAGEIPWRLKNETKAEFITVAWCKFFECLHSFPLVKDVTQLNTLHLCEAPGAFIAALNHYLYTTYDKEDVKWSWLSTTLNPYYEGNALNKMVIDDRFILHTLDNWLFHEDFTGNIIERRNIENMAKQCAERLGTVQLITADGSIDCADVPDSQEDYVAPLHLAEIITALSILADGGNFIVKMFTLFESSSVSLMYLLNCVFNEVHVYKPATSKRGNSEVYVICLDYKKDTPTLPELIEIIKCKLNLSNPNSLPLFAKAHLPSDFLLQHEICCRMFMNHQMRAIESNIFAYETKSRHYIKRTHNLRSEVSNLFYERYNVQPLPPDLYILQRKMGATGVGVKMLERIHKGSYLERKAQRETSNMELHNQVFRLFSEVNDLEKTQLNRYTTLYAGKLTTPQMDGKNTLRVYKGTPVEQLKSSLFAAIPVLLMRLRLYDLLGYDPIWQLLPKCLLDNECIVWAAHEATEMPYYKAQQSFWLRVLNAIETKNPNVLVFQRLPFLTHYAVSLLTFLAENIYENVRIITSPEFSITLETPQRGSNAHLTELIELLSTDTSVHCILDITKLHRTTFSDAIIDYNNAILLESYKSILEQQATKIV